MCRLLNRPTRLALNFADHLGFENLGVQELADLSLNARTFIGRLEEFGVPVCYIGTGPRLTQNIPATSLPGLTRLTGLAGAQQGYSRPQAPTYR